MTAPAAKAPASLLGRHRLLAPTAGARVSPLCLGAMNFGDAWKGILGECDKKTSFEMLDYFYSQGGNFIDTAVNYQNGESETWLGEWMAQNENRRHEMFLATKYTGPFMAFKQGEVIQSNFGGNSTKSMYISIENSLKRLKTDYIDLYYVHVWDYSTSIEELMQSLNHLVQQRKVLYLGVSDTPAWVVVKCNAYARAHGLRPFSVYQGRWSAAIRDFEREIIPMCKDEGMALAPWGALGGGFFKSPSEEPEAGKRTLNLPGAKTEEVSIVLDKIAKKKGVPITSIGLAYVMHKAPYNFPIVGGRKVSHLKSNIEALGISLSQEEIDEIETGYNFELGFPHEFLGGANKMVQGPDDVVFNERLGHFDFVRGPRPIPAHTGELGDKQK